MVARAYECLSNETKREEYDRMLAIEKKAKKADFMSQKKAFEEFIKAQETDATTKGIKNAEAKFKLDYDEMDRKRGIDRSKIEELPMSSSDAIKRLKDIELEREQDELEFTQPEIFPADKFNREEFNALFELKYKQDKDDQLIKHGGSPSAFNDIPGSSFISCEGNYDDIFDEENNISGTDFYGSINDIGRKVKVSKDDIDKVKGVKTNYSAHNTISKDYRNDIRRE